MMIPGNLFRGALKFETKRGLRKDIAQLQHEVDILISGVEERKKYTGNPYKTYESAGTELAKKYEGTADWGAQQTRNIIDIRSAFIVGQGIKPVLSDKSKKAELEFIEKFIKHNDLDEEMPQEFAKEAEIEGRFLCKLIPNKDKSQVDLRYVSFTSTSYKIESDPEDYKKYLKVVYKDKNKKDQTLEENEFVYKKFSGRTNKVNETMPKVAMVLRQMEALDKALWDWRNINHYFSMPTPYFKCETKEQAKAMNEVLEKINWKIGKTLAGVAEFSFVSTDMKGIDSLEKEIISNVKIISGETGIPVHFLGLPDLMSNRAVSTDLFELIVASTNKERHVWIGAYEEIFSKALIMANQGLQKQKFDPEAVGCEIPYVTAQKIKELSETWLPLYTANIIDLDYMLSMIPNVDAEKIKKDQNENDKKILKDIKDLDKEEEENQELE